MFFHKVFCLLVVLTPLKFIFEIRSYIHVRRLEQRTFVSLLGTLTETHIRRLRRALFYNLL